MADPLIRNVISQPGLSFDQFKIKEEYNSMEVLESSSENGPQIQA